MKKLTMSILLAVVVSASAQTFTARQPKKATRKKLQRLRPSRTAKGTAHFSAALVEEMYCKW